MTARQLIKLLADCDPDAEVMVSAETVDYRGYVQRTDLPTLGVKVGSFPELEVNGQHSGKPWVRVVGTVLWGQPGQKL